MSMSTLSLPWTKPKILQLCLTIRQVPFTVTYITVQSSLNMKLQLHMQSWVSSFPWARFPKRSSKSGWSFPSHPFFFIISIVTPSWLKYERRGWMKQKISAFLFMLFACSPGCHWFVWLAHVLAHLWAAELICCVSRGVNGVAGSSPHSWLLPNSGSAIIFCLYYLHIRCIHLDGASS